MFKKLLLATVAAGLVSAATLPLQFTPAVAMTCKEAAKEKYSATPMLKAMKQRRAYMKSCKAAWKAAQ
jgi:hypothetical protein